MADVFIDVFVLVMRIGLLIAGQRLKPLVNPRKNRVEACEETDRNSFLGDKPVGAFS